MGRVPLKLVTGPANAEKAREVLDGYEQAIDRDPILVVPTFADVQVYRRELAERGVVFGTDVRRWSWLTSEIARRGGVRGRPIGDLARERVTALAVSRCKLRVLSASAETPGFARALMSLCDELAQARVDPGRWYVALRAWAKEHPGRSDYAEDLGDLYGAYRRALEALGRLDPPMHATAALDALRLEPARWGGTPLFLYGFDDLTRLQLDAIETIAGACGADVTVSLPHEAGRVAFAGRAGVYQELLGLGAEVVELPARAEHYAAGSRAALHHIERNVFEGPSGDGPPPDADEEILLLQGGGERAELELVGAHVRRLIDAGMPPGEIAVVLRSPGEQAALIGDVFGSLGVPYAMRGTVPAGHTALGRGLIALIRCALLDGSADDLLTWLRTPGHVHERWKTDALEATARRESAGTAVQARALWEQRDWPLETIDRIERAARQGPVELCERLAAEVDRLMRGPHRGDAAVLGPAEALEVSVAAQLRRALLELAVLAQTDEALVPPPRGLVQTLAGIEVYTGSQSANAVTVADPLAVRARRVRALFACSLQERSFPRAGRPESFLGDADRRAINAAGGVRLDLHEDRLGAERYLFYSALSRATDLLALGWHDADDDGAPTVRSLFVDDVLDLFDGGLADRVERRELGAVGFAEAPTAREAARLAIEQAPDADLDVIAPLRDPAVLARLAARETWSASALEAWVSCPVKWYVERLLRPTPLVPDPEPMVRGELAHKVLEDALGALAGGGGGPLRPEHLPEARRLAIEAIERHRDRYRISPNPQRVLAALHRLEADVLKYLEFAATSGSDFSPTDFELRFGGRDDDRGSVEIAEGLRLQGRIDRIDRSPDRTEAIIYDYKGATGTAGARWAKDGKLQLALYMLALPDLIGAAAVGGLYQPLRNKDDTRPRGLVLKDVDPALKTFDNDRVDDKALAEALAAARDAAAGAVSEIRAGRMSPCPGSCGWKDGGCSFPSICRAEG